MRESVCVETGSATVCPSESGRLLGLMIHQSLKWKEHLIGGQSSLITSLSKRLSAIKRCTKNASFKTRLKIANACFISILSYTIVVWGATEDYLLRILQVMQNKAARYVTRLSWFTPTRRLLKQCNWLSVKQLVFMHTASQVWKVRHHSLPVNLDSHLKPSHTRSGRDGNLALPPVNSTLARKSFLVRAPAVWNSIPSDIRNTGSIESFKKNLRQWIISNVDSE